MAGITDQLKKLELSPSDRGAGRNISAETGLGYEIAEFCVQTLEKRGLFRMTMEKSGFFFDVGFCVLAMVVNSSDDDETM